MDETLNNAPNTSPNLSVGRNLKIGFFHLGSGMADVLMTGVWNRVMIADLGFAATPVSLLASLRYFLAPIGIWAGRISDRRAIGGFRRLFWVWLGRAMMVASVFMLGLETANLARGAEANLVAWGAIAFALLLFSLGNAISGNTFLALIYDRSAKEQRGRAVGIVWTFLLLGFTIGGILFSVLLPSAEAEGAMAEAVSETTQALSFTPDTLQNLFFVSGAVMGALWFFSLLGEEKRTRPGDAALAETASPEAQTSVRQDLALVWQSRAMRFFFWYLALSMAFAFSQDAILEPFAGEVFGMEASITSRFAGYWGSMSILATIAFLFLSRRYKGLTNTVMSRWGVSILVGAFAMFALSSLAEIRWIVTPGLVVLGVGLGIWNVGTLGLMMDMSPFGRAGTFLGFWTLVVTLARGTGVSGGGIVHDAVDLIARNPNLSYGAVFVVGAIGLSAALWALGRVNTREVEAPPAEAEKVFAGAMD
ncbi:MAG: BCD family MFS transporter [bacterium]|nr:BCD family MFS transporter [bacterium]